MNNRLMPSQAEFELRDSLEGPASLPAVWPFSSLNAFLLSPPQIRLSLTVDRCLFYSSIHTKKEKHNFTREAQFEKDETTVRIKWPIRYDTRCYFNLRTKADMSQLNLPHGSILSLETMGITARINE